MGHIIHDTDGEFLLVGIVKYGDDVAGNRILGSKTVSAAKDGDLVKLGTL